ncbi:MAG: hypothetical protein EPN73_13565 [Paraburkholderia sp.]|uniref:hypothetical protein n=1 Tax=Paraburkholderia sp. TaxID=1926495 RepID=UPI00122AF779|nr:hypothetical protein [Paraburkholderia sp.]TAL95313.1 MAG: hypothetical protein EPN73_13565 [Paraburkholderia sp.]
MAERVSGPYRGYYISAAARLVAAHEAAGATEAEHPDHRPEGLYVGSVSLSQRGPDDPHRIETLVELGAEHRFATEADALEHVEKAAREYVNRLVDGH